MQHDIERVNKTNHHVELSHNVLKALILNHVAHDLSLTLPYNTKVIFLPDMQGRTKVMVRWADLHKDDNG